MENQYPPGCAPGEQIFAVSWVVKGFVDAFSGWLHVDRIRRCVSVHAAVEVCKEWDSAMPVTDLPEPLDDSPRRSRIALRGTSPVGLWNKSGCVEELSYADVAEHMLVGIRDRYPGVRIRLDRNVSAGVFE